MKITGKRAVLAPAGITNARRILFLFCLFGAAGGWEISPVDYMRFMNRYVGSRASAPVVPFASWPGVSNLKPGQVAYGPGANVRAFQVVRYKLTWIAGRQILTPYVAVEYNTWHSGALGVGRSGGSLRQLLRDLRRSQQVVVRNLLATSERRRL